MTTPDIQRAFDAQQADTLRRRREFGLTERRKALTELRDAIRRFEPELIAAMAQDFDKPEAEVLLTEILPVQTEIAHTIRHLRRWMRPRRAGFSLATAGTRGRVRMEARGVCLILAPWNYPFNLAVAPLIPALAAGNAAIVKPSELSPATSDVIARMLAETFPPELVTVVQGGKEVAEALLALPFDHIFFTGSPAVGSLVMAAAAKTHASVTLELGGKSPTIIGPGASLKKAAKWVAYGKFVNAGQTCIAPDYLLVHESVRDKFIKHLQRRIVRSYGEGAGSKSLAGIISPRHADRLRGMLKEAQDGGAEVISGGTGEGTRIAPTLVASLTPEMALEREEIFGPILPVLSYSNIGEAISRINSAPKPLALYIFEQNKDLIEKIVNETSSGGVGVNLTLLHFAHPGLPFGGVNMSGFGTSHGEYGFRAFSHERAILTNRFSPASMLFPPYGRRSARWMKLLKRFMG